MRSSASVLALLGTTVVAVATVLTGPAAAVSAPAVVYGTAALGGTVEPGGTVTATSQGAVAVKFYLDGTYLAVDHAAPFQWRLSAPAGSHVLRVRAYDAAGLRAQTEVPFTIVTSDPADPDPEPVPPTPPPAADPPPADGSPSSVVDTVDEIRSALATARPGAVVTVADGEYVFRPRLVASAQGRAGAPIVLRGSRRAVLRSSSPSGDYGLHITGDHWRVQGLTVAHASKGIVLDGSVGTVLDGVQVHDIGDEGVHFRSCSSDGVLRNSYVHETGVRSPGYGEGVYVGSASSNWSKHSCTDGRDNSERVLVEDNVFRNTAAEGADLKEGTESGTLRRNLFDNTGFSGSNSADSAVDAKGNGWVIEGNTVQGGTGAFLDAFQTHSVSAGYGVGNAFRGNTVRGPVRGWGFGLYPARSNTVACDNTAPGAVRGLANVPCT